MHFISLGILAVLAACTPEVTVKAPTEPIRIDLNVNIEHHVKIEVAKELDKAFAKDKDIF